MVRASGLINKPKIASSRTPAELRMYNEWHEEQARRPGVVAKKYVSLVCYDRMIQPSLLGGRTKTSTKVTSRTAIQADPKAASSTW